MTSLIAYSRSTFGKKVKELLGQGMIPAQLYGHRTENITVQVPIKEFSKALKEAGQSSIITLIIDEKEYPVLIHDVQYDAINQRIVHADFYKVNMEEKISTKVPLRFEGEAPAVKEQGGVLVKAVEEIEIEALPANLPHEIVVDISILKEIHQNIHVSDLVVGKGVSVKEDLQMTIATVIEQAKEEPVSPPEAVTPQEGASAEQEKTEEKTE